MGEQHALCMRVIIKLLLRSGSFCVQLQKADVVAERS